MQEKTIYLIRHGESVHNQGDQLSGVTDVPLSARGRAQCQKLARFFRSRPIDEIYVSPLSRAIESARLIFPGREFRVDESLIELDFGAYEGAPRSLTGDAILRQWEEAPGEVVFPGGQSVKEHAQRAYQGFLRLIQESQGRHIACISHRVTIRLLVAQIIGLPLNRFRALPCSNCSVTIVTFREGKLSLKSLNIEVEWLDGRGYGDQGIL